MREALAARSDRDFTAVSPPTRSRGRQPERSEAAQAAISLALWALRRPGPVLATFGAGALAVIIAVNALSLQTMRHPNPLFGEERSQQASPPAAARSAAAAIGGMPAASPTPRAGPPAAALVPAPAFVPVPAPDAPLPPSRPAPTTTASVNTRNPDQIGDVLRGGPSAHDATAETQPAENRIMSAQRALFKLGYGPLTADGLSGPLTRAAIERFERDRHLPVTGELNPRTVKELSARSGLSVE